MVSVTERDPRHPVRKMQKALREIKDRLREDIVKIDEPELKAMFERTAEVIGHLEKALRLRTEKRSGIALSRADLP